MRRIFAVLTGAATVLTAAAVTAPASEARTRGTADEFVHIMKIDNGDMAWWNHLADTGFHRWRAWENASAPLVQDDAKIASRLLGLKWPDRVADDVRVVILAKINEGAAWAEESEADARGSRHLSAIAQQHVHTFNLRSHRAENRVRAAFGLAPVG